MSKPLISLVIPVFNEEDLIKEIFERSINALKEITDLFEIICVDDGSSDKSLSKLIECHKKDNRFKVLMLARNFGHQAAYTAGLEYAKGEYIAMMDGDMQDPPELIKEMYEKLINGDYDIVYGKRTGRQEKFPKNLFIKVFHIFFKNIIKIDTDSDAGNFSMLNRKALNALLSFKERNRYLPGLRSFVGFRQGYIEYFRPDRMTGEAKMNFGKLFNLGLDAFFSFSNFPIKICLFTGLAGVILFFLATVYTIIGKFSGIAPFGWSSTLLSIYLVASIQLLFLGIMGEYIFRIYKEIQGRPIFIVKEFLE
ncbi:MAG: glycosyltransferase family 2 protein [Candidatus Omnitrophica bacterium]|nr:glycosyltransferase family 2 protein [Candidatus Omnitrophota bacterium]